MTTGTVKWFDESKGYGFIVAEDNDEDIFVHHTGILGNGFKTLKEGQTVSFEPQRGPKGLSATNVDPQ